MEKRQNSNCLDGVQQVQTTKPIIWFATIDSETWLCQHTQFLGKGRLPRIIGEMVRFGVADFADG